MAEALINFSKKSKCAIYKPSPCRSVSALSPKIRRKCEIRFIKPQVTALQLNVPLRLRINSNVKLWIINNSNRNCHQKRELVTECELISVIIKSVSSPSIHVGRGRERHLMPHKFDWDITFCLCLKTPTQLIIGQHLNPCNETNHTSQA